MKDAIKQTDKSAHVAQRKAIRKARRTREPTIESFIGLDCEYPVDDIIMKCIRIQKLLDESSRTIKRFTKTMRALNEEMNTMFRPLYVPAVESRLVDFEDYGIMDHRKIFDEILAYSDMSEAEEPNECNTSLCETKIKREKKQAAVERRRVRKTTSAASVLPDNNQASFAVDSSNTLA